MKYLWILFFALPSFANPYPDPNAVPKDRIGQYSIRKLLPDFDDTGIEVVRVQVDWIPESDRVYSILFPILPYTQRQRACLPVRRSEETLRNPRDRPRYSYQGM